MRRACQITICSDIGMETLSGGAMTEAEFLNAMRQIEPDQAEKIRAFLAGETDILEASPPLPAFLEPHSDTLPASEALQP